MASLEIKGFIDLSLVDWDGEVSAVIFLPHCNFRCPFCYNLHFLLNPEEMPTIPFLEIKRYLRGNKRWLDGVVISGGEPTIHSELPTLCRQIKKLDLSVKLDTNGTNSEVVQKLIAEKLVDYVAVDVKAPLTPEKYSMAAGVDVEGFLVELEKTLKALLRSSVNYEFRTTLVPQIHTKSDVEQICETIKGCEKYVLQSFKGDVETLDPKFRSVKPFRLNETEEFLKVAREIVPSTVLR